MKLIAWDTSSKSGAIVALEWDQNVTPDWKAVRLVAELALNVDSTHSERLLWGIHQVLESARWKLEDVDLFGVGVGPGSFTGLRIGITTARTLSHTFQKPLVSVSSLAALLRPVAIHFSEKSLKFQTITIAVTDACKGELFALWGDSKSVLNCTVMPEENSPGLWKRGVQEQVLRPEDLMVSVKKALLRGNKNTQWVAIGEGRQRYLEEWNKLPIRKEIVDPLLYPNQIQGRYLGLLVWEAFQAGLTRGGIFVYPRYLRASDAELKLKAGLLARPYALKRG